MQESEASLNLLSPESESSKTQFKFAAAAPSQLDPYGLSEQIQMRKALFTQNYRYTDACAAEFEGRTTEGGNGRFLETLKEARRKVDRFLELCREKFAVDGAVFEPYFYGLYTGKGDTTVEKVQEYAARDGYKYLVMWAGNPELFDNQELWHVCAKLISFTTSLDDICVPYAHVKDGRYKFQGESLTDLLRRMHQLGSVSGRDPMWLQVAEEDVYFGAKLQFFEKVAIRAERNSSEIVACPPETNFIQMYRTEPNLLQAYLMRNFDGFSLACTYVVSYLHKLTYSDFNMDLYYASALGDMVGMDIGKEIERVASKCPTNFIESPDAGMQENRWRFVRACELFYAINSKLQGQPELRRFSEVSLFFACTMDRYLERQTMTRFPIEGVEHFVFTYKPISF